MVVTAIGNSNVRTLYFTSQCGGIPSEYFRLLSRCPQNWRAKSQVNDNQSNLIISLLLWFFWPRQNLWQRVSSLINDCWFRLQIRPYAEATASIQGYLSILWVIRAGVSGHGTLIDVGLPMTLSLQVHPIQWCATVSADLTVLRLSASVYYQWCWFLGCGSRNTLFRLGSWSAIRWNRKLIERCGW